MFTARASATFTGGASPAGNQAMRFMALRYAGQGLVVCDGLQQPLLSEGFAAQFKGPQLRVRPAETYLDAPVFDIDDVPDAYGVAHHKFLVNQCTGSSVTAQMRPSSERPGEYLPC